MMRPPQSERFVYFDDAGVSVGCVDRHDKSDGTKSFVQYRFDGGTFIMGLAGRKLPLYRLPETRAAIGRTEPVYFVEGERKADTLANALRLFEAGGVVTTIAGGANAKLTDEHVAWFRDVREVDVLADSDAPGRKAARERAEMIATAYPSATVRVVDLFPDRNDGSDIHDWLDERRPLLEFLAIIAAAPLVTPPSPIALPQPTKPVVLADLLFEIRAFIRKYVVVSEHQLTALVLWVAHSHAFAAAQTTPYIAITSAEPGSGKTRLLETLALLVRAPWMAARISAAALVRKVDKDAPTVLFDELDATFNGEKEKAEATRGILNSGYNSEGRATVCVGQGANIDTRDFKTFSPKALAGIGKLPDTIRDRSIVIELKRKIVGEEAARYRSRHVKPEAAPIRQVLETWAATAINELTASDPAIPAGISDRAADCWESLLAIADLATKCRTDDDKDEDDEVEGADCIYMHKSSLERIKAKTGQHGPETPPLPFQAQVA